MARSPVTWFQGSQAKFLNTGKVTFQAGADLFRKVFLDGSADEIQLQVQGNGTQTSDILVVEKSDGTDLVQVTNVNGTHIRGSTTNDAAAAGYVAELMENAFDGTNAAATGSYAAVASLALTAGDWDVEGIVVLESGASTTLTLGGNNMDIAMSTTTASNSGSVAGKSNIYASQSASAAPAGTRCCVASLPRQRISLSATTTYYLNARVNYGGTTPTFEGVFNARRVR